MKELLFGLILMLVVFLVWIKLFPTKKYMSDIYQEMYRKQEKQTKILTDMRNVFFSKNRKSHNKGAK